LGCGWQGVGGGPDEREDRIGVGDHGHVVGRDLHGGGALRGAKIRWAAGAITWSPSATRNQDGSALQAGTPITSPRALQCNGCWTANMTLALTGSTSAAKWLTKSSSGRQAKPWGRPPDGPGQDSAVPAPAGHRSTRPHPARTRPHRPGQPGWGIAAEGGDELAALGVPGHQGRPVWRART
jgi:hypothetical protein